MKTRWIPLGILLLGSLLLSGAGGQRTLPLTQAMGNVVPHQIVGYTSQDVPIPDAEAIAAGFSNYLYRVYEELPDSSLVEEAPSGGTASSDEALPWFSLYVAYFESQTQGRTIHSPKNCLPGGGWEALSSEPVEVQLEDGVRTVNRYLIQNGTQRSLALYWYQGRGRVAHSEYRVKFNLLLDAAFRRRSDEALVRVIVPVGPGQEELATDLAISIAKGVMPSLELALPH